MKTINFLLIILFCSTISAQNQIVNGNFQTGAVAPWQGFNNQVLTDNLIPSEVGNINNGEGSLYQTLNLESNETYTVAFNYRWVAGTSGYVMNVRAKDENSADVFGNFVLNTTTDTWMFGTFTFTVPSNITSIRLVFYKENGNRPLRLDNVYLAKNALTSNLIDPMTPINAQPEGVSGDWTLDFSDEFNNTELNTTKWLKTISTSSRAPRPALGIDDWWWVESNAFLDGSGNLVLRGTKVDDNTMHCGSIESKNLYEPTFGFLEARIQIAETSKGNHTAFWTQGSNMGNVDNSAEDGAEIDIFESAWVTDDTKAVVHFDGYGPDRKNHTIPYNTPGLHSGYHTFGLNWTPTSMDIYYDGVKVQSTNSNKPFPFTVDPNGYSLIPQVPEWLWLSVGASFGDGDFQSQSVGTLSDARVDYVRVYKSTSTLSINENNFKTLKLFPNPSKNEVNIDGLESDYTVNVYKIDGRLVLTTKSAKIDTTSFKSGIYLFEIVTDKNSVVKKIIVN